MKTVLLVDNDPGTQAAVADAFAPYPEFRVVQASSFPGAMWALFEHEVHLVIVQLGIPEREGLNLLAYLANYHSKMPVLTLSGSKTDAAKSGVLSWRGHVSLPLRPRALVSRVQDCLRAVERGEHQPLKLHDLLRILAHEQSTCMLQVLRVLDSGSLMIVRGKISHAECGEQRAQQAVRELLQLQSSCFRLEPLPPLLQEPSEMEVPELAAAA